MQLKIIISILLFSSCLALSAQDKPVLKKNLKQSKLLDVKKKAKVDRPINPSNSIPTSAETRDTSKSQIIQLIKSNQLEGRLDKGEEVNYLTGEVILKQGSMLMYCDTAILYKTTNEVLAFGNVVLLQPDSLEVFSDSLRYNGNSRKAKLAGDVRLLNKDQQLLTPRLDYDLETKVASYYSGGTLLNENSQLTSKIGYYYIETETAFFKEDVVVVDERFELSADTLKFEAADKVATFLGPTRINLDSIQIYTEAGYYDTQDNRAEFTQNPQLKKNDQIATSDKMDYFGDKKETILTGNAQFTERDRKASAKVIKYNELDKKTYLIGDAVYIDTTPREIRADKIIYDSETESFSTEGRTEAISEGQTVKANQSFYRGDTKTTVLIGEVRIEDPTQTIEADTVEFSDVTGDGFASGNVVFYDSIQQLTVYAASAKYNKEKDYLEAYGRPLMQTIMDGDTLSLAADTLVTKQRSELDSAKVTIAYRDVRIYKSDLQALCDSLSYDSVDSIFYLYKNPIMWSDTSQFVADTIRMVQKNEAIDRIYLIKNSLILNSPDEYFFNQIKGRNVTAIFEKGELDRMKVEGNAESVYYALDDGGAYIGVNKSVCSNMEVVFGDNEVQYIDYFEEPKSNFYPMTKINHEELKLKGFRWDNKRRPKSVRDLGTKFFPLLAKAVLSPVLDR